MCSGQQNVCYAHCMRCTMHIANTMQLLVYDTHGRHSKLAQPSVAGPLDVLIRFILSIGMSYECGLSAERKTTWHSLQRFCTTNKHSEQITNVLTPVCHSPFSPTIATWQQSNISKSRCDWMIKTEYSAWDPSYRRGVISICNFVRWTAHYYRHTKFRSCVHNQKPQQQSAPSRIPHCIRWISKNATVTTSEWVMFYWLFVNIWRVKPMTLTRTGSPSIFCWSRLNDFIATNNVRVWFVIYEWLVHQTLASIFLLICLRWIAWGTKGLFRFGHR